MYKHHEMTIKNVVKRFKKDEKVLALIVGGSIAHGYERENSDIDIFIVVSQEEYEHRIKTGTAHYFDQEDCTYEEGYIDGKYISMAFLKKVSKHGSDAARYAFKNGIICFSKIDDLQSILDAITKFPNEKRADVIKRFYSQFEAWTWYCYEGLKLKNDYLLNHSISNMILFGGRLILAYNKELYPYHKWFMTVLEDIETKPKGLIQSIESLLKNRDKESVQKLYELVINFADWGVSELNWPNQFMIDSELNWLEGKPPVADL